MQGSQPAWSNHDMSYRVILAEIGPSFMVDSSLSFQALDRHAIHLTRLRDLVDHVYKTPFDISQLPATLKVAVYQFDALVILVNPSAGISADFSALAQYLLGFWIGRRSPKQLSKQADYTIIVQGDPKAHVTPTIASDFSVILDFATTDVEVQAKIVSLIGLWEDDKYIRRKCPTGLHSDDLNEVRDAFPCLASVHPGQLSILGYASSPYASDFVSEALLALARLKSIQSGHVYHGDLSWACDCFSRRWVEMVGQLQQITELGTFRKDDKMYGNVDKIWATIDVCWSNVFEATGRIRVCLDALQPSDDSVRIAYGYTKSKLTEWIDKIQSAESRIEEHLADVRNLASATMSDVVRAAVKLSKIFNENHFHSLSAAGDEMPESFLKQLTSVRERLSSSSEAVANINAHPARQLARALSAIVPLST